MQLQPKAQALSARLQDAIRAKGTTAAAIAKACGFSRQNMQRFINGEVSRSRHFSKIAEALGVSVLWLTMGDPHAAPTWWTPPGFSRPGEQPRADHGAGAFSFVSDEDWRQLLAPSVKSMVMRGDRGRPIADDGMRLLIETDRALENGDVIVLHDAQGMELVRCGEVYQDHMVVAGVDRGFGGRLIALSAAQQAPRVVGVLF